MKIRAACAAVIAVALTGCGGSSSKSTTSASSSSATTSSQTTAESQSTNTTASATTAASADLKAHWFAVTSRFPGAGQFQGGPVQPSSPNGGGLGMAGTVNYYGPGKGPSEVAMYVSGPLTDYDEGTLKDSAAKYVTGALGGKVLKGPVTTTMGGQPALAYFGMNTHGSEYALVVMHNDGNVSARGTYVAQMTAPPAVFRRYVPGFDTVLGSFQLIG